MAGTCTSHGSGKDREASPQLESGWQKKEGTTENELDKYYQEGSGKHQYDLGRGRGGCRRPVGVEQLCRPIC